MSRLFFLCLCVIPVSSYSYESVEISPSIDRVFYREYSEQGDILNTESGYLPGMKILYGHLLSDNIRSLIEWYYGENKIKYDGFLQDGKPYLTESKMIKEHIRIGVELSDMAHNFSVFIGQHYWDRHILPRNGVLKLSEYYYWKSIDFAYKYTASESEYMVGFSRLFDAGLDVDLTEVGYGLVSVSMPDGDGFSAGFSHDISTVLSGWRAGVELQTHHFSRSKTDFTSGIGITEPENLTIQLRVLLNYSF